MIIVCFIVFLLTFMYIHGSFVATDAERRQRVDPAGLSEGGGAPDGPPAPAHRAVLRRLHGRRAAGHGVRIHEARRPQPIPQVKHSQHASDAGNLK